MRSKILMLVAALLLAVPVVAQTPHNADQVGLSIFSAPDNAIRVNMAPVPAASTPNPHDLNQTFLSIFDQANNAIQALCVSGCGTWTGTGAVLLAPVTDQDIIGAYALSASKFWGKSAVGVGGIAVLGSSSAGGVSLIDAEVNSTTTGATQYGAFINVNGTPTADNVGSNQSGVFIESVQHAHNSCCLQGLVVDTFLEGTASSTFGIAGISSDTENAGSGSTPIVDAIDASSGVSADGATTTDDRTVWILSPNHSGVGASMTHHYGLYIADQTLGGGSINPDPWAIYSLGGKAHFVGALDAGGLKTALIHTGSLGTCDSTVDGTTKAVDDSDTNTWGATVVHTSGADHVLAYCDGTNWTVAGK